jgi:hypothetical protein
MGRRSVLIDVADICRYRSYLGYIRYSSDSLEVYLYSSYTVVTFNTSSGEIAHS